MNPEGHLIETYSDVTEHYDVLRDARRMEQLANDRSDHLESVLMHADDAVSILDADGRLILCNQKLVEIWQLPYDLAQPGSHIVDLNMHRLRQFTDLSDDDLRQAAIDRYRDALAATENSGVMKLTLKRSASLPNCSQQSRSAQHSNS